METTEVRIPRMTAASTCCCIAWEEISTRKKFSVGLVSEIAELSAVQVHPPIQARHLHRVGQPVEIRRRKRTQKLIHILRCHGNEMNGKSQEKSTGCAFINSFNKGYSELAFSCPEFGRETKLI